MNDIDALKMVGLEKMPKDEDELKLAYRKVAVKLHPDNKATGSEAKFKALQEAMEVIRDRMSKPRDKGEYVDAKDSSEQSVYLSAEQLFAGVKVRQRVGNRRWSIQIPPMTPEGTLVTAVCGSAQQKFRVRCHAHPLWDIRGEHVGLEVELPTSKKKVSFEVPTPSGKNTVVEAGAEARSGMTLEVPGLGLSTPDAPPGNLYLKIYRSDT